MENSYVAGLFDGEGCIRIAKNHGSSFIYASLANTHKPVLLAIAKQYGGNVYTAKKKRAEHHLTVWCWKASSNIAYSFLQQLYPYLVIKKEQALIAFKFQETMNSKGRYNIPQNVISLREELDKRMRELKRVDFPAVEIEINPNTLLNELCEEQR